MSVARTKSQTPGIFSFGKSGTSPCSSFEETIETSADFTTFAGTEGRASSAWPTEKSSGPSFARTTRGHIAWRENWSAHPTRNLWWISGKRTMASVRFGPARGVDSSGRILTIGRPTSPQRWGSSSPGFGDSHSRTCASEPERPTRSRRIGDPRGELFRVLPLRSDPSGIQPDHALHLRGVHSVPHEGTAGSQLQRGLHGVFQRLHVDGLVWIHETAPTPRDDGRGPSSCRLLFRVPAHVLQSTPGLSHGPPTLAAESDAHDDRVRLVLRFGCNQTAGFRPERRGGSLGSDQSPGLVRL